MLHNVLQSLRFERLDMFRDENASTRSPGTLVFDSANVYFRCLALWRPHQIASRRFTPPNLDTKDSQLKLLRQITAPLKVLHQQLFHLTYFRIAPDHRTVVPGHSPIPRVSDLDEASVFFFVFFFLNSLYCIFSTAT